MRVSTRFAVMGVLAFAACDDSYTDPTPQPERPQVTVFTASGNITAKVDEFRNVLGASNGGTAGEQPAGRREIGSRAASTDSRSGPTKSKGSKQSKQSKTVEAGGVEGTSSTPSTPSTPSTSSEWH